MDLVKCPRCGEEYSPSYRQCPFCEEEEHPRKVKYNKHGGRRVSEQKKTHSARGGLIAVLLVVLALLTWYLFGEQILKLFTPEQSQTPPIEDVTPVTPPDTDPNADPNAEGNNPSGEMPVVDDPQPSVDVSGAVLSKTDFTTNAGERVQLSVSGTSASAAWSSADSAVATVDASGLVTGVSAGTTTIIARVGERELSCIVRVKGAAEGDAPGTDVSGAALNKTDFTAAVGENVQLKVSGTTAAVTWSIGNSNIASISAGGTVKGVSAGMTKAYAKVGSVTLECIVRIK